MWVMNNIELIYNNIRAYPISYKRKEIRIEVGREEFTSDTLVYIASRIKYLMEKKITYLSSKLLVIDLNKVSTFKDKITYLMLDALIYDLFNRSLFKIAVLYKFENVNIHHAGFGGTAIYRAKDINGVLDRNSFIAEYEKSKLVGFDRYRKIITRNEFTKDREIVSKVYSDIGSFLRASNTDEIWVDEVSEVVSELLCNVEYHTNGDCLLDLDISPVIYDGKDPGLQSINIAVVNFSPNRLYDGIMKNLKMNIYSDTHTPYKEVYQALKNHRLYFNDEYTEEDFYLVTAFQNHVTSRPDNIGSYNNGGTGLTTLIQKITDKTEFTASYVLSGFNVLYFDPVCLKSLKNGFIGFNSEGDYVNRIPEMSIIRKSAMYIPGSIYNLVLIKRS